MYDEELEDYWEVVFFPLSERRNSPRDYIDSVQPKSERAAIYHALKSLARIPITRNWTQVRAKPVTYKGKRMWQLREKNLRIYLFDYDRGRDARFIVITHACRKTRGKANPRDLEIAFKNMYRYLEESEI